MTNGKMAFLQLGCSIIKQNGDVWVKQNEMHQVTPAYGSRKSGLPSQWAEVQDVHSYLWEMIRGPYLCGTKLVVWINPQTNIWDEHAWRLKLQRGSVWRPCSSVSCRNIMNKVDWFVAKLWSNGQDGRKRSMNELFQRTNKNRTGQDDKPAPVWETRKMSMIYIRRVNVPIDLKVE